MFATDTLFVALIIVANVEPTKLDVPETFEVVMKTDPKLDVPETFEVVELMNGTVSVLKLNIVFDAFDVNPAATILVVVKVFETTKFANG